MNKTTFVILSILKGVIALISDTIKYDKLLLNTIIADTKRCLYQYIFLFSVLFNAVPKYWPILITKKNRFLLQTYEINIFMIVRWHHYFVDWIKLDWPLVLCPLFLFIGTPNKIIFFSFSIFICKR